MSSEISLPSNSDLGALRSLADALPSLPDEQDREEPVFQEQDEGWDRTLLDLASKCAEPICWAYGVLRYRLVAPLDPSKFNNCENAVQEIALRAVSAAGALAILPFALPLGILHKAFRAAGFFLQKTDSTHVRGSAPEATLTNTAKVMTWNLCGVGGGMHYDHAGIISWQERLDQIVKTIRGDDPDVLVLQEIYDTAFAEALIEKLQNRYAHFFCHLGANTMGSVGGLMVLSKCAVHKFTNTSFTNNDWTLNRTFAVLEIKARPEDTIPCARIIGTHFTHDDNDARREQFTEILTQLEQSSSLPTVLVGDLNLEREWPEEGGMLLPHFEHGYQENTPTCTSAMLRQWDPACLEPEQRIDYISRYVPSGGLLGNVRLVKAFSPDFNTRTALSDHHGLHGELVFNP